MICPDFDLVVGDRIGLWPEEGSIIPEGVYTVSKINDDGSFHVGGNTAVWPRRIFCKIQD
jgi:hypothetical protein